MDGRVDEQQFAILPVLSESFIGRRSSIAGCFPRWGTWRDGRSRRRKYFACPSRLGLLVGTLLFGIKPDRYRLIFRRDEGMP